MYAHIVGWISPTSEAADGVRILERDRAEDVLRVLKSDEVFREHMKVRYANLQPSSSMERFLGIHTWILMLIRRPRQTIGAMEGTSQ